MIGSLLWDSEGGRDRWRSWRLDASTEWRVAVPIRYGRKSATRGNTYTMVFDRLDSSKFGQGVIVECRRVIRSLADLKSEAQWLWAAEMKAIPGREDDPPPGVTSTTWGRVAILLRQSTHGPLTDGWKKISGPKDEDLMVREGRLEIEWPEPIDGQARTPLDILLATTNKATKPRPTPRAIAEAWNQRGYRGYFDENQKAGILTSEDTEIRKYLTST